MSETNGNAVISISIQNAYVTAVQGIFGMDAVYVHEWEKIEGGTPFEFLHNGETFKGIAGAHHYGDRDQFVTYGYVRTE